MRQPDAGCQRKPRQRLVLIFYEEQSFQMPGRDLCPARARIARTNALAIRLDKFTVVLAEAVDARLRVVLCRYRGERNLRACIIRAALLRGADGGVIRIAIVIGAIVVIEGRDGEQQDPG